MITRKNGCGVSNLLVAAANQLFENLCSRLQARFNLSQRMLTVRVPDNEIGDALQQS
jgi:hypothetical protein